MWSNASSKVSMYVRCLRSRTAALFIFPSLFLSLSFTVTFLTNKGGNVYLAVYTAVEKSVLIESLIFFLLKRCSFQR